MIEIGPNLKAAIEAIAICIGAVAFFYFMLRHW